MTSEAGAAVLRAAASMIGVPFRLHGRDPVNGLDCIGLVGHALELAGHPVSLPRGYRLRHLDPAPFIALAGRSGLRERNGVPSPADILLLRPAVGQFHLAICDVANAIIHAHAGLGKVVRMPLPREWAVLRIWHPEHE